MDNVQQYENGIKPHGKGIQITFIWNGERHRPTLRIEPTKNNLKFAGQLKSTIEREIALGTYTKEKYGEHFPTSQVARELLNEQKAVEAKKVTTKFRELAKQWLLTKSELGIGSLIQYESAIKFWNKHIGNENVEDIKPSALKVLANSQGWSAKNRNNKLIPLRGVFGLAWDDELIKIDPTSKIENGSGQKKPCDPLEPEEVDLVLAYMEKTYDPQIWNYFEVAFFSGLRPSEMISLRWEDIDWQWELIRVQRARTYNQEHETKTYIVRDVEMNSRAKQALERQKQHTFLKDGYVFEDPVTNRPYPEDRPLRRVYWHPALKTIGIRGRRFYQTRHTYATMNLMAGANPMWVSKQMGHANMAMLLNVYAKWINGADKSTECDKLDAFFAAAATSKKITKRIKQLQNNATNMPQTEGKTT